jgi:hypothetical protein
MLELRPNCECCDRDLPWESPDAMICTFECTFGGFTPRPIRPPRFAAKYPPSTKRVLRETPCAEVTP